MSLVWFSTAFNSPRPIFDLGEDHEGSGGACDQPVDWEITFQDIDSHPGTCDEDEATLMSPNQFIIRSNGGENQFGCKTFENFNPTRFNLVKVKGEAEFGMKPISQKNNVLLNKIAKIIFQRSISLLIHEIYALGVQDK